MSQIQANDPHLHHRLTSVRTKKRKPGRKGGSTAVGARTEATSPASDWMTPAECAAYRKVSISCLNKERVRGDGPPFIKIRSRLVRYSRRAVDDWLEAQIRRSTSETPQGRSVATP
jgi:hypothetical protein